MHLIRNIFLLVFIIFRNSELKNHEKPLKGNNDLLTITRKTIIVNNVFISDESYVERFVISIYEVPTLVHIQEKLKGL